MAVSYEVIYIDDLDGTRLEEGAAETIKFAVDGKDYEIDLSEQNAAAFREALAPYLNAARRDVKGRKKTVRNTRGQKSAAPRGDTLKIRAWARDNGYTISDRGRIPADILEAYNASN